MIRTYKYRLYPNREQIDIINKTINTCRILYNDFLYERTFMYKYDNTKVSNNWQIVSIPHRKKINPYLNEVYAQVLQDVARRADKSFKNFFRRVKAGDNPGYPRYKGVGQYNSFTYPQNGFKIESNKLILSCVGNVNIKLHRPIDGDMKTCTITIKNGKYYASFTCDVEVKPITMAGESVGIDMGITDFCITSDGSFYPSVKAYRKSEKALNKAQRKVSRRIKRSNRHKKAIKELSMLHEKVANQRRDISHKVANDLLKQYDMIAHEKLQVNNMIKNHNLAKSISDAGWGTFFNILHYKAESAGKVVIEVDPKNTSQICSSCGSIVHKKLSERKHNCPYCGYSEHRDINAAKNILKRAIA